MAERDRKKRRKRKDSTTHLKPPLDFIESPLDGRKYYCTPVQAARRPFMAESLPVDDEEAKKWVSPQFPTQLEGDETLLALLGPRKKSGRGKTKNAKGTKGTGKETSSTKHLFEILQFENEKQLTETEGKNADSLRELSCRRSQRLRLKELQRAHFLFQASQLVTPVNKRDEVILAYETPDQELIKLAARKQSRKDGGE